MAQLTPFGRKFRSLVGRTTAQIHSLNQSRKTGIKHRNAAQGIPPKLSMILTVIFTSISIDMMTMATANACANTCSTNEMIIGCDDRVPIPNNVVSAEKAPWRFIGRFRGPEHYGPKCTGTLIADRFVLSAAHCFDTVGTKPLGFKLAQSSDHNRPFGTNAVRRIFVPNSFAASDKETDRAYDYAVAELVNPIEGAIKFPNWGYLRWNTLKNKSVRSVGYPATQPSGALAGKPWSTGKAKLLANQPFKSVDDGAGGLIYTELDGAGGQSGAPVYAFVNGKRKITGVFIGAPIGACEAGQNWVARLTRKSVEHIKNTMKPNTIDIFWRRIDLPSASDAAPGGGWP